MRAYGEGGAEGGGGGGRKGSEEEERGGGLGELCVWSCHGGDQGEAGPVIQEGTADV